MNKGLKKYQTRARVGVALSVAFLSGIALDTKLSKHPAPSVAFVAPSANRYEHAQAQTALIDTGPGFGSGVVVHRGDKTFVWTANHVAGTNNMLTVKRILRTHGHKAGHMEFTAKVIANFPEVDAALLWVDCPVSAFEGASFTSTTPVPGTTLFHVGNFLGDDFDGSISRGILSQVGVHPDETGWPWPIVDQTDARCLPGSSGGPVFDDTTGEVVGLIVGGPGQGALGISCFVPVRELLRVAKGFEWAMFPLGNPTEASLQEVVNARKVRASFVDCRKP